ncbi:hypothetical protein IFM89_011949 [Coptis chinensis]|uniref:OTU domain-containing protein n=1 Tax=Coptis chinensis TaxID=261450 RepID=A0A835H2P2_9MAGN|nr:hypothetical protein IFM89_011949 [Coptis chinensis]
MEKLHKEVVGMKLDLSAMKSYLDESFKGLESHANQIEDRVKLEISAKKWENDPEMRRFEATLVELENTPAPIIRYKDALPITPKLMKETMKAKRKVEFGKDIGDCSFYRYLDYFPDILQPLILDIEDPKGDGNCGFRALAMALGYDEEGWVQVRVNLISELRASKEEYIRMFGHENVTRCEGSLLHFKGDAPEEKWMLLPEHGYLAASKYSVAIVYFSMAGCHTFLPLKSAFNENDYKVIGIGRVPNHF